MSSKFKPLFLIFILHLISGQCIYAQKLYDKYYTNVAFTEFLSDSSLDTRVEAEFIDLDFLSATIFHLTNVERVKVKLDSFDFYDNLYLSALLHSESMVRYNFFDHLNRQERKWREPSDRILYFDSSYIALSENIAENNMLDYKGDMLIYRLEFDENGNPKYLDKNGNAIEYSTYESLAKRLVEQWMNSRPHRENILNDAYKLLGCACAIDSDKKPILIRCTQNFGTME